jgi:glucosamine 6-phosphate synthetase-like amidotransferase/phosphosugar isomerase protein
MTTAIIRAAMKCRGSWMLVVIRKKETGKLVGARGESVNGGLSL